MSLPNLLSLVRLPLAGLLWVRFDSASWVLSIVAIAAATDAVDGRVARALRRRLSAGRRAADQAVGAWLDPLCDKAFAASMLAVAAAGFELPVGAVALILGRELLVGPLVVAYHLIPGASEVLRFDFSADWQGKLTTMLQFVAAGAALLWPPAIWPLAIAAAASGMIAVVRYVRGGILRARAAARNPLGYRSDARLDGSGTPDA